MYFYFLDNRVFIRPILQLVNDPSITSYGSDITQYLSVSENDTIEGAYNFSNCFGADCQGTSWTFEEQVATIKDIEKATAMRQKARLGKVSNLLEFEYGFSADRASEVTATISNWKKLSKTREMTAEEANTFAMEVTGADFTDFEDALTESAMGNSSLLNELVDSAAELNGTSPEAMSALIESLQ